jgi:hypothetical protein
MITSEQKEVLRILDLVAQKEKNSLETLLASVDIISKKEVV